MEPVVEEVGWDGAKRNPSISVRTRFHAGFSLRFNPAYEFCFGIAGLMKPTRPTEMAATDTPQWASCNGLSGNQGRFVGTNTVFWTTVVATVILGRKILTGEFGSPDFVAVMIILPIGIFVGSIVMWNLFFKSNPYREEKRR